MRGLYEGFNILIRGSPAVGYFMEVMVAPKRRTAVGTCTVPRYGVAPGQYAIFVLGLPCTSTPSFFHKNIDIRPADFWN
jgi:hypothetical protein